MHLMPGVNIQKGVKGICSLLALFLSTHTTYAALPPTSVVPHDSGYYTKDVRNTRLIYTENNLPFAEEAADIELSLQPLYENVFGYRMDEVLNVGLTSEYNQIANGFSTQYPNNRQINYIGGALTVDYFSSPSWLKTLLYHETAHNYQLNAKGSPVSQRLHFVFGNGFVILPWFTVPNIMESPFLLEGNAVLNESWHGNGGRLYSGRFKAATLQQAKAGNLKPEVVYNNNYNFLYGSHFYTLGGYYQYYLAENYGLEKTDSYWLKLSDKWSWPFLTNLSMREAVGVDFNTSFAAWRETMQTEAAEMVDVDADTLVSTQFFAPMNADANQIYFIVNETGRGFPELVIYDKASGKLTRSRQSYAPGKVIRLPDGRYATQASVNTSPWRIYAGLFDEDAMIVDDTRSKVVEGYLGDGSQVYFNVPESYDQPQLYVGGKFYARVNSSVLIDHDNLYYFVQGEEKNRTLYRNKEPLFTIKGYYSYVSGVDSKGAIYFIANTKYGSGLFRYYNGKMTRAHAADTIFDARLIDDHSALVAVMGADAYTYKRVELTEIDEAPTEVVLFVEKEPYYRGADPALHPVDAPMLDLKNPYFSFLDMNYSGTNLSLDSDKDAGFTYDINVTLADPLAQNQLELFAVRNTDEFTLGGITYGNSQYFLQYTLTGYNVLDRPDVNPPPKDKREHGVIVNAYLPFVQTGHYNATLRGSYFQDYESDSRKPRSFALDLSRSEQYGVSFYRNFLLYLSPYTSSDRGDTTNGGEAAFQYGFPSETYLGLNGQTSSSDAASLVDSRGVKLVDNQVTKFKDSDPGTIIIPGLKEIGYVKSARKASLQFKQVFNLSSYYFRFPVSLRREAAYLNLNRFDLEPFGANSSNIRINEAVLGVTFDLLLVTKIPIPVSLEYIHSDDDVLTDSDSWRINAAFEF
jgi:hypothetical protein